METTWHLSHPSFPMVFYLVGLGLGNERDITVKGLEIVRRCAAVYLEAYTAILAVPAERLVRESNSS